MASSSSLTLLAPTSSSSSSPPNCERHVFPSFHGADVRKSFLSHVLKELRSKGIDLFLDNDMERSKSIGPELVEAIRGSRIAIVLLSKNYASSTWCLNELAEIIKCRERFGQTVIPLFYELDPTDVKKQTGDFGKVFLKTCKGKAHEDIQRWKCALTEVAQITGYHSTNWKTEANMIEDIATEVSNKLNLSAPSSDFDYLVGIESQMTRMRPFLQLDSDDVRKIGIWGPPGIGKTIVARSLFNRYSQDFQLSVFIDNIKTKYAIPASSDDYSVKLYLQKQLMSQLTNETGISISHLGVVKDRLRDKKVLVVLDDVDHLVQLEAMAKETYWFGPGSRIIVTTQDQRVLKASGINHIHRVKLPSYGEALQMFCMYAFDQKYPKDGFEKLCCEVVNLVGRLPLGIKVMGSYFRGMSEQDSTEALPRLKAHLDRDGEIANILKFSYDALNDEDKRLVLHIACFFNGERNGMVESCLEKSFEDVRQGLRVLSEKSLISIENRWIYMDKLLVQLGKQVVRKESVSEPGKRQFLIDAIDIGEVLHDDKAGSSSVIGISFEHTEAITWTGERSFERLSNLQFLKIHGHGINPKSMNYMSRKLRVLDWRKFNMSCFPSNFNPEFLVELRMTDSSLEKLWEGNKPLSNLKRMDLSSSRRLKELPDLSTATNLYDLNLNCCSSLLTLPSSIGSAINLKYLDLCLCSSLVELPSSMRNLRKLSRLVLYKCSKLEVVLANINLESLEELDLSGRKSRLRRLVLRGMKKLVSLPTLPDWLGEHPSDRSLLENYTESSTEIEELDPSIGRISSLHELFLIGMKKLVSLPQLPDLLGEHPSDWSLLENYTESSTNIQELDPCIGRVSSLKKLVLRGMKKLVSLPQLPDSLLYLDASDCETLERLDCSFRNPNIILNFKNCFKLNQEAKDLIIQTPTYRYAVFPAEEVPICFSHRSYGSSLTVKLNQMPLGKSTKFKAGIICADVDEAYWGSVCCTITSGRNSLAYCKKAVDVSFVGHLLTFEVEVETEEVTSTELIFDFELLGSKSKICKIKEYGIFQLPECQPSSSNRIGCGCGSNTTAFCYLLKMISRAVDKLESNHDQKILPVFVTLDPVRNTPSHLHAYLKEFDDRILGLTGSASAMRQMAQEYRVYFKKVQEDGDDYLVDTSHNMYLLNPKMEVVRCFGVEYNPDDLSQEVLKEVSSLSQ
ncbi:Disease resistance protein (TIR-NBS-LRR class) family [Raphanus sativus]|nr:Disease resistance protein (TIR-NBS-LRR class) family [Raphanus sativus]